MNNIMIYIVGISILTIYMTVPINHPNLCLNNTEINMCRSSSRWLALLISIFMYETTDGDVCGNAKTVYNTKTNSGSNLDWERV